MASSAAQREIASELEKKKEMEEDDNPEEPMDEDEEEEDDDGEGDDGDVEDDVVFQIGDTYSCKRQDGSFHDAEIVKTRMNKKAGREEFFVHYVGLNRRQNEWVEKTRLVIPKPEGQAANSTDPEIAEDGKASLKRKNEDGASEAKRAKVTVETAPSSNSAMESGNLAELTCLLCSELFKDPVMVECGHNFCRNCIDQAWIGQESFTCPDCKDVVTDKLYTTNRALANLVKKTVGNTAIPDKPTEKPKPAENCPDHDERLKLYCKDDGMLGCIICRDSLKHANHNFLPILEAVGLYRTEVSSFVAPLEEGFKVIEQLTTQQSEKVEQHKSNVTESREYIVSEFEKLRTFLKEREEKLLERLQEDGENLLKEMETNMVNLQESHDNIKETIATGNERMNDMDSLCFLTGIKPFIEKCEEEQKAVMVAGSALLSKDLCMGTFKGPIQYSILKQLKSIIKPPRILTMNRRKINSDEDAISHVQECTDKIELIVKFINLNKGRGVFALSLIEKGDFVVEYRGELINLTENKKRQRIYTDSMKVFLYEFKWNGKIWCIDAAKEDGSVGRLVKNDQKTPNCKMKKVIVEGKPHLCLFAIVDINPGEEITYNYGDSSWPWRDKVAEETMPASSEFKEAEVDRSYSPETARLCCNREIPSSPLRATQQSIKITNDVDKDSDYIVDNSENEYVPDSSEESSDTSSSSKEIPWIGSRKKKKDPKTSSSYSPYIGRQLRNKHATNRQSIKIANDVDEDSDYILDNSEDEYVPDSSEESSDTSSSSKEIPWHGSRKRKDTKTYSKQNNLLSDITSVIDLEEPKPGTVSVHSVLKKKHGARVYNKKQYCLYCEKPFSKIARHIEHVHSNEPEVARALMFPKCSKQRRLQLQLLRNKGNFSHNCETIRTGCGVLVPCKQPQNHEVPKNYMHCINCRGLFAKKYMWRHMKNCPLNKKCCKPGKNRVQALCAFAQPVPPGISTGFWKVLNCMNQDDIYYTVKNDSCIMQLGQQFYNRIGSEVEKHEYLRQKLREIGRLLLVAKRNTPLAKVEDFVIPSNFLHVVNAVKLVAGYDSETNTFKIPSLALKLGHSLSKISSIIECRAVMDGCTALVEKARNFRTLYDARWNELIAFAALKTLKESKWNMPQRLPFTEDVKKMHLYLDKKQQECHNNLLTEPSVKNWSLLAKVTLAQVILFNRRREGEVSKMLLTTFISRDTSDLHGDVALALSELEKKLCQHFTRIEIRGKRGRKVPILLSPTVQSAMELLAQKREECSVTNENVYMFARPSSLSHLRGSDCIRIFAQECGAQNPQTLTSTKLRKHIATVSKVLNLNDTELDQLADFLGHDIRVHREYYRLPEGTLQLAKISKLLMALEKGRIAAFKGKNLEDINIDPNEPLELQSEESEDDLSPESDRLSESHQIQSEESEDDQSPEPVRSAAKKKEIKKQINIPKNRETTVSQGCKVMIKKKWDKKEVEAVEKHMMNFIQTFRVPGKNHCVSCIMAEPSALKARNWLAVKFYINNRITALKRKTLP